MGKYAVWWTSADYMGMFDGGLFDSADEARDSLPSFVRIMLEECGAPEDRCAIMEGAVTIHNADTDCIYIGTPRHILRSVENERGD